MKRKIKVVGGAILKNSKILMAQRPYSNKEYISLKWEFPGGKIEDGETKEMAIIREIKEELGCEIKVETILESVEHEYPDLLIEFSICICSLVDSEQPICREHNSLQWTSINRLSSLDLAELDAKTLPFVLDFLQDRLSKKDKIESN